MGYWPTELALVAGDWNKTEPDVADAMDSPEMKPVTVPLNTGFALPSTLSEACAT